MELPSKLIEQIAFNTRPKIEEHMLVVMDKSTHDEHLSQPKQTNVKQFKIALTFLTGYNGIFNFTDKNKKFYFVKSITDKDGYIQINTPPGAYEIESLITENKRTTIYDAHYRKADYPVTIKTNFSTVGSIIEISSQGPKITFLPDDSIQNFLRFIATTIYEEYFSLPNPVDILSFYNIFPETNIVRGMIFIGRRSGIIHNRTKTVDPGYKYVERFARGVSWFITVSEDFISSTSFELKNEKGNLVSFNGQSITFRLSIREN